ncbi:MAG: NADH-quinone oxidoreductase subunit C [Nanoarchaeota archaeon]
MNNLKSELGKLLGFPADRFQQNHEDEAYLAVSDEEFERSIKFLAGKGVFLIDLFAVEDWKNKGITLCYVFEKKGSAHYLILKKNSLPSTNSIAREFPAACWYEREITDGFGINFNGAFDTRRLFLHEAYPFDFHPLRKSVINEQVKMRKNILPAEEYSFKKVNGEGVYQIPVGPVHAGIIEPGHFRFSVIGETIFNLEIRMFWKHRGIEKLAEGKTPQEAVKFAEAISGDETVANALAFCQAVEKISQIKVPARAQYLRVLLAEMERIYSLLGDLAGMIIDVAYPAGASPFFILREDILRWNETMTGSRFLKNSLEVGGLKKDINAEDLVKLRNYLKNFSLVFNDSVKESLSFAPVLDRFENAGIVKKEMIRPLNLTGPLARASGMLTDVRIDHPYSLYQKLVPYSSTLEKGDVLSRFKVKAGTIEDSINLIKKVIADIVPGEIRPASSAVKDGFSLMAVESARGQNIHWLFIQKGKISRYKIRTASFCNWQAIEHAVLGNIVPDFPLVNKSMNLSYAGTDL